MSILELPANPAMPANVVTIRAKLPRHHDGDPGCVLPCHVAVVYPENDTITAATYIQDGFEFTSQWRILGVTLDYIPFVYDESRNGSQQADRHYAVAVAGLVPIAMRHDLLAQAMAGDPLYAKPEANHDYQFHKAAHKGVVLSREFTDGALLVGTIYGLPAAGEHHCLVLLSDQC